MPAANCPIDSNFSRLHELALQQSVLGNILEGENGANNLAVFLNGSAVVFGGKTGSVLFPKDIVVRHMANPFFDRHADRARMQIKGDALRVGVLQELVLVSPFRFLESPASRLFRRGI